MRHLAWRRSGMESWDVQSSPGIRVDRNPVRAHIPPTHQLKPWGDKSEPAMTGNHFALFDTAIGRCGIVWGARGITGVQLPMGSEDKTRTRIRQSHGDIAEAAPSAEVQGAIDGIV